MDDVKLVVRQQGLVASEIFGATYGSGGIGRNATDLLDVLNSYFTTQLKTDEATVKAEHALATSTSASFFGTYGFLVLSVLFFCASFCLFIRALVSSFHKNSDKALPLLVSNTYSNSYILPKDHKTCSSDKNSCKVPEPTSDAQISCMQGIHLHLNAIEGEQEGIGVVHDALCDTLGEFPNIEVNLTAKTYQLRRFR
jgi:hypothetical protein